MYGNVLEYTGTYSAYVAVASDFVLELAWRSYFATEPHVLGNEKATLQRVGLHGDGVQRAWEAIADVEQSGPKESSIEYQSTRLLIR